ncbi:hypothetical protein LWI29_015025 [Acer saccharum]|uniref:Uncharacterized protein n=1 Tax=Acer saccharum TaxID=4024 RepID=A0AA39RM71_ACESA|nr:hypothetical protein LWI29_015025 [Acer saccharum]
MARPNSNSKPKPTLPKGRPTTLVDMMQFVSNLFDFEESESVHCDILDSDNMVDCGNITQEELVDCVSVKIEESDDQIVYVNFENFTQQMVEAIDREVVDKAHIESTNLVVEEIDKTIENIVFEDFVMMSHVLVGQIVDILLVDEKAEIKRLLEKRSTTPTRLPSPELQPEEDADSWIKLERQKKEGSSSGEEEAHDRATAEIYRKVSDGTD